VVTICITCLDIQKLYFFLVKCCVMCFLSVCLSVCLLLHPHNHNRLFILSLTHASTRRKREHCLGPPPPLSVSASLFRFRRVASHRKCRHRTQESPLGLSRWDTPHSVAATTIPLLRTSTAQSPLGLCNTASNGENWSQSETIRECSYKG
jgi:hypothetical protein